MKPETTRTYQGPVYVNPQSNGNRCLVCNTYSPILLQVCPMCDISSRDAQDILTEQPKK